MAKMINVSQSLYDKVETGARNPSYNFICKFIDVFPEADIKAIFFTLKQHEL